MRAAAAAIFPVLQRFRSTALVFRRIESLERPCRTDLPARASPAPDRRACTRGPPASAHALVSRPRAGLLEPLYLGALFRSALG